MERTSRAETLRQMWAWMGEDTAAVQNKGWSHHPDSVAVSAVVSYHLGAGALGCRVRPGSGEPGERCLASKSFTSWNMNLLQMSEFYSMA